MINRLSEKEFKEIKSVLWKGVKEFIARGNFDTRGIYRIEEEIPIQDPVFWLKGQKSEIRSLFGDRDGEEIVAGIGSAYQLSGGGKALHKTIDEILVNSSSDVKFFGGEAFPVYRNSLEWSGFGEGRFFVPSIECGIRDGKGYIACNISNQNRNDKLLQDIANISYGVEPQRNFTGIKNRVSEPGFSRWSEIVESSLRNIRLGDYQKIVLGVRRSFDFETSPDPFFLLQELFRLPHSRYNFLIDFGKGVFLGSSPERLYKRRGNHFISEAVAGTVPSSNLEDENLALGLQLLSSDKDIREHEFVIKAIKERLKPLCSKIVVSEENNLLKLTESQHLKRTVKGIINSGCGDGELLETLHPTPAVGGYPGSEFLEDIRNFENFDRGWYSGVVGFRGFEKSDFAVGIRSLLTENNSLHLYSGVGIVEGSDPLQEWEETELKLRNFMDILDNR